MRVIFDSNVFDDIIAGRLDVSVLIRKRVKIYITHIQREVRKKNCSTRRSGSHSEEFWKVFKEPDV